MQRTIVTEREFSVQKLYAYVGPGNFFKVMFYCISLMIIV